MTKGLCQCGCGEPAPIAKMTNKQKGHVKGQPMRFIKQHHLRRPEWNYSTAPMNPTGLCLCGCGKPAPIAKETHRRRGQVKGQPMRFITGHYARLQPIRLLAERFWARVNKDGPLPSEEAVAIHPEIAGQQCWIYGKELAKQYPNVSTGSKDDPILPAHHVAWFLATGEWSEQWVLHKCDRGACVRFSHLFEGSARDNTQDMIAKRRDRITGARHHRAIQRAKLTDAQVAEIRHLGQPWVRNHGYHNHAAAKLLHDIAKQFDIDVSTIRKILSRTTGV